MYCVVILLYYHNICTLLLYCFVLHLINFVVHISCCHDIFTYKFFVISFPVSLQEFSIDILICEIIIFLDEYNITHLYLGKLFCLQHVHVHPYFVSHCSSEGVVFKLLFVAVFTSETFILHF